MWISVKLTNEARKLSWIFDGEFSCSTGKFQWTLIFYTHIHIFLKLKIFHAVNISHVFLLKS